MQWILILLIILFGTESFWLVPLTILGDIGMWKVFRKCGEPGWQALIPYWSDYKTGYITGRDSEGRVVFITRILYTAGCILELLLPVSSDLTVLVLGMVAAVGMVEVIYRIRIYMSMCAQFSRKRGWVILWALSSWIPALVWGCSRKFQPQWKPSDIQSEVSSFFSGAQAEVMDQGLTVNLEERTSTEMFKKKYLLRDIHMSIKPGHMVLLLGGSGAGKTTLLNAINGYEPAKAEVVLNGQNVYTHYKRMQYEIGFVPQQELMRNSDTVLHTLNDAAALRLPIEFTAEDRRKRVAEVMEMFGLTSAKGTLVAKMSGGQKKRLSIAMEFISNPSLFILDEPDSGLDGVMARSLMQQLRQIADQGKIVIVITHTPDRVIDLFDDVIVLARDAGRTGRLAYYGSVADAYPFFDKESMERIVLSINRPDEGGEGRADEFIKKYAEVQHG